MHPYSYERQVFEIHLIGELTEMFWETFEISFGIWSKTRTCADGEWFSCFPARGRLLFSKLCFHTIELAPLNILVYIRVLKRILRSFPTFLPIIPCPKLSIEPLKYTFFPCRIMLGANIFVCQIISVIIQYEYIGRKNVGEQHRGNQQLLCASYNSSSLPGTRKNSSHCTH